MKWVVTAEEMPPPMEGVITWKRGHTHFGHAHHDPQHGWYYGCECFPGDPPDYWMIPSSPESES